jgi:Planctomycete extracellular
MTIQRRNRTRRLQVEPLEARDVPSVVSPHAGLLRPMARAEVHKAAHHQGQAPVIHRAPASAAASSTASSSTPPAGGLPAPIIVVLGPVEPFVVTQGQVEILYEGPAPPPVVSGSVSST